MSKKKKTPPSRAKLARAAARRASIKEHGGTGVWRPRAARFPDRKKQTDRRACRGKHEENE